AGQNKGCDRHKGDDPVCVPAPSTNGQQPVFVPQNVFFFWSPSVAASHIATPACTSRLRLDCADSAFASQLKGGAKNSTCCFKLEMVAEDNAMTTKYLFDNAAEREARARMAALAAQHNDATFRYMEKCGIALGWSCLEIGAGEGSVARWMAARVGPSGFVLA